MSEPGEWDKEGGGTEEFETMLHEYKNRYGVRRVTESPNGSFPWRNAGRGRRR